MGMLTLKNDSGFTFLEVMVAFSIVALVIMGIYQLQSQNIALGIRTRFNVVAPMLADRKITELISSPENFIPTDSGDFGEDYPGYSWQTEVSDVELDDLEETTKRFKKIDVYVDAADQGNTYQLTTFFLFDSEP